ncbi:unnamed protein product [Rotaria sordida]|uniref:TIR domain-containing protein n=1 Tax=Rotaria sordida TaxID=392033 RepID=A0A814S6K6_9BILA|nr:unnamed protein product [Rotaria sordida]CAF1375551.1 unnamed protein product [Rotaria sordida]
MTSSPNLSSKYVVFSYNKKHEELVLKIYYYLKNENLPVWINIQDGINKDIYQSMDNIVEHIRVLVCFMTPMYQTSKECQEQVEFAKSKRIPIISCRLLPNWKPSGWFNKITNDQLTIDLHAVNQRNFKEKMNKLKEKIIYLLLDDKTNSQISSNLLADESFIDQSILLDDSYMFCLVEYLNSNCIKKKPYKHRILPKHCRLSLSNLMICNNEYILISANHHLHLFDGNLKYIRSNKERKINENDLKDLSWSSYSNCFIILMKKEIYLMDPLSSKISIIEYFKLKDHREEYLSCTCSEDHIYLIKCQFNSNIYYLEEYYLSTFRFLRKFQITHLIGTSLVIQNGSSNQFQDIEKINSIRYNEKKLAIIIKINSHSFIYIFQLHDQPVFLMKIPIEDNCRMTILNPINQFIIFKDYLSNLFIKISIDFENDFQLNQYYNCSNGLIDFNGKLRNVALFGRSNLVFLIDNALLIYQL